MAKCIAILHLKNVLITDDGRVLLTNYVVLGDRNQSLSEHMNSSSRQMPMSMAYVAPELVLGDVKSQNYTTDIYAMGVLLYQLITGHLPFSGTDQDVLAANLRKSFPMKDVKRSDIKRIIQKATEKPQNKRYGSVAEMRVALEHVKQDGSDSKVSSKMLIGAATIVAAIVVGVVIFAGRDAKENQVSENIQDSIPIPVIKPSSRQLLSNAIAYMDMDSSDSTTNGSKILMSLAKVQNPDNNRFLAGLI